MTTDTAIEASIEGTPIEAVGEIIALTKQIGLDVTRSFVEAGLRDISSNHDILLLALLDDEAVHRPRNILPEIGMTSGGLTKLLDRLEGFHLITREHGEVPGDQRGVTVSLTLAGHAAITAIRHLTERSLQRDAAAVRRVIDLLDEVVPAPTPANEPKRSATSHDTVRDLAALGEALLTSLKAGTESDPNPANTTLALWHIGCNDMTRPHQLVDLTGLSSGGVTKLLDRLEAGGLIRRTTGRSTDGRAVVTVLTDRGRHDLAERLCRASEHLPRLQLTMWRLAVRLEICSSRRVPISPR